MCELFICPLGYERVYLPLYKVADTPFYIRGDDLLQNLPFQRGDRTGRSRLFLMDVSP